MAGGASCTINVTFNPTALGPLTGTLTLTDNAPDSPEIVQLNGTGVLSGPNVSPLSLTFTNQLVGSTSALQPVTISNTSTVALSISSLAISSDWTQTNNCLPSVAPSASCTINVSFAPTANGNRTGTLTLTDDALNSPQTVALSGTGAGGVVSLSATSLAFASQTVSSTSASQPVTVTNTGTAALTSLSIAASGDFAQTNSCPGSLASNASCTTNVTFTPTAGGNRTGAITLTDNAPGSPQTVSLSGQGAVLSPPRISPEDALLPFNATPYGTTSTLPVIVTNTNAVALSIPSVSIDLSPPFTQTNNCLPSIPAGGSCTINVSFSPNLAQGHIETGFLTITDGAFPPSQTVTVQGTGLFRSLGANPNSLSFSGQPIGTTSASQPVTVTNNNAVPMTIPMSISSDWTQTTNCAPTLAPNSSCVINVSFAPTADGARTGVLSITGGDSYGDFSPQSVTLTGTGLGPTATLSATSVGFSNQGVGTSSASQPVTLQNNGNQALSITSITLGGANSGDFTMTQTCGSSLAASVSCPITVTFTPTALGSRSATVTLVDSAANSPQTITLTGTGIAPSADMSPTSVTFPGQFVGTTGLPQNVTLTNNGNAALTITSVQATTQFQATNGCTSSLAAGVSCTISVFFDPNSAGGQTGTLTVTDNAPGSPQTIQLSGTGMDFGMASSTSSATIAPGQTATYALTVAPLGGLNQMVSLTCAGAPSLSTCMVSPSSVTLNGSASAPVTISVTTTAGSMAPPKGRFLPPGITGLGRMLYLYALLMLAGLVALAVAGKRRPAYVLGLCLATLLLWSACGGGGGGIVVHAPGTPAGTYPLTVTGTVTSGASANTLTHSVNLSLVVN